ncbi:MAG: thiamine phosphate synthase [Verrucomicrobiota bacterium]
MLYAILDTGYADPDTWPELAEQLIAGGVGIMQIRAKQSTEEEIITWTQRVHMTTRAHKVPLILNDYPHLVPITGAEGAHIGQDDMQVSEARQLAGAEKIIGKSTHSLDQVKATAREKPDYIGFGPLFATPTKPTYVPIGLEDIDAAHELIDVPVYCIGGIKQENLPKVVEHGARNVVIVSGLLTAESPRAYAEACGHILHSGSGAA